MQFKSVSLETLISTLLFNIFIFSFSISVGMAETKLTDRFIFKVANQVYSLSDLKKTKLRLAALKCMYPDSLTHRIFWSDFKKLNLENIKFNAEFDKDQIKKFEDLLPYYKLMTYSQSHEVVVQEVLKKYFKLSATQNKCDLSVFEGKEFESKFQKVVQLEVFVRSRFLPSESQGKTSAGDIDKAVSGARNLINSIDQQIDEEAYW